MPGTITPNANPRSRSRPSCRPGPPRNRSRAITHRPAPYVADAAAGLRRTAASAHLTKILRGAARHDAVRAQRHDGDAVGARKSETSSASTGRASPRMKPERRGAAPPVARCGPRRHRRRRPSGNVCSEAPRRTEEDERPSWSRMTPPNLHRGAVLARRHRGRGAATGVAAFSTARGRHPVGDRSAGAQTAGISGSTPRRRSARDSAAARRRPSSRRRGTSSSSRFRALRAPRRPRRSTSSSRVLRPCRGWQAFKY